MENQPQLTPATDNGKTIALVSYLTLIGFIVALIMHSNNKTSLGAFHLRQMLFLVITGFAIGLINVIPFLGWIISLVVWILLAILWIFGLIAAANGEEKPMPLVGEQVQQWFANVFK